MVAIVAIPAKDELVWNISSEKVPHLTLLFLGDRLENTAQVSDFVGHAVETSLNKFLLDADRRDVLGDKSADVVFFGKYGLEPVQAFRQYLLGNDNILKAYNSVEQYPKWVPHLTLGYPDSPAKPGDREFPTLHTPILFDRIALWTGDYEGVEFPLTTREYGDLSMAAARGEEFLEHYGIKGMKWGVIRDNKKAVAKAAGKAVYKKTYAPSSDAKNAKVYMTRAKIGGVRNLDNKEMRLVIERMELEQKYRDLYGERQYHDEGVAKAKRFTKKGARWAGRLLTDILRDGGSSWIKRPGSNASGRVSARVIEGSLAAPRAIGS